MGDELGGADIRRQRVVLGHVAEPLAQDRPVGGRVDAEHGHPTGRRREQPEQDLDQRGLAGAVRPDQPDDPV